MASDQFESDHIHCPNIIATKIDISNPKSQLENKLRKNKIKNVQIRLLTKNGGRKFMPIYILSKTLQIYDQSNLLKMHNIISYTEAEILAV